MINKVTKMVIKKTWWCEKGDLELLALSPSSPGTPGDPAGPGRPTGPCTPSRPAGPIGPFSPWTGEKKRVENQQLRFFGSMYNDFANYWTLDRILKNTHRNSLLSSRSRRPLRAWSTRRSNRSSSTRLSPLTRRPLKRYNVIKKTVITAGIHWKNPSFWSWMDSIMKYLLIWDIKTQEMKQP